jgi:uncharacterized coiled-coil DUF342 family protein
MPQLLVIPIIMLALIALYTLNRMRNKFRKLYKEIDHMKLKMEFMQQSIDGLKTAYDDTSRYAYELITTSKEINDKCVAILDNMTTKPG